MPVYHLLLTNHNPGNILYSYYFQEKEKHYPDQLVYEQLLQQSVYRTAAVKPTRSTITLLEDRYVVFQRVGEIIIYLTGVNETDEIILSDVLDTLIKLLQAIIGSSSITEAAFLNSENYGKFVIAIDEMLPEGFFETNDVESLLKASKLKNH